MIRWEYRRKLGDVSNEEFATLGQLGWELISVLRNRDFDHRVVFYFKRQIEDETDK